MKSFRGFTLIELLVAIAIVSITAMGIIPFILFVQKENIHAQLRSGISKIIQAEISTLRAIEYSSFTSSTLTSNFGYTSSIPSVSPDLCSQPDIPSGCPPEYETELYKGGELELNVSSVNRRCPYIIKLCIDENYIDPYLKKVRISTYYKAFDRNSIKSVDFFIYRAR